MKPADICQIPATIQTGEIVRQAEIPNSIETSPAQTPAHLRAYFSHQGTPSEGVSEPPGNTIPFTLSIWKLAFTSVSTQDTIRTRTTTDLFTIQEVSCQMLEPSDSARSSPQHQAGIPM